MNYILKGFICLSMTLTLDYLVSFTYCILNNWLKKILFDCGSISGIFLYFTFSIINLSCPFTSCIDYWSPVTRKDFLVHQSYRHPYIDILTRALSWNMRLIIFMVYPSPLIFWCAQYATCYTRGYFFMMHIRYCRESFTYSSGSAWRLVFVQALVPLLIKYIICLE